MAGITTHVLDTNLGRPLGGIRIDFSRKDGDRWTLVKSVVTNADGRTDAPLVRPEEARAGEYELVFHVDGAFRDRPGGTEADIFIDRPAVRFTVSDVKQHYHVPLLCTAGSCSTYRGS